MSERTQAALAGRLRQGRGFREARNVKKGRLTSVVSVVKSSQVAPGVPSVKYLVVWKRYGILLKVAKLNIWTAFHQAIATGWQFLSALIVFFFGFWEPMSGDFHKADPLQSEVASSLESF